MLCVNGRGQDHSDESRGEDEAKGDLGMDVSRFLYSDLSHYMIQEGRVCSSI